ncbi:MAG: NADPH-dependent glutamate synthase [Calditrichaceae bacterium]|nr:NADPH-dependent glutamate synthase [Calditrichaceae bacterium]
MAKLTAKERMQISRHPMVEQDPVERSHNFKEVNLGYTAEMAIEEAQRCIQCPKPTCTMGCPVSINIKGFINLVAEGDFSGAVKIIKIDNALPAICGRVCPQEEQCEQSCVLTTKYKPVAIGYLERFVADYERENGQVAIPETKASTGKRIAIVGSGPAGLSCANDLIQWGHQVTVFEALHELGGVLVYGIPEFRLPKEIVRQEINNLKTMGVEFQTDIVIGRTITIDELLEEEGYDAVFVGVGAGLPWFMGIPGENLVGVYTANEFLTRVNLMKAYQFPDYDSPILDCRDKNVAVFGGGNTAMDAVRTSLRLGAKNAYIVYRRSEKEMPARVEEVKHAKEEGVQFKILTNPVEFIGDEDQWLKAMKCIKMELGEPDDSGRRRPVPIAGSEYITEIDIAIIAIGNGSNPLIKQTTPEIEIGKRGTIIVDPETMETSKKGVFAGGDIVTGGATVILAMGAGRTAAKAIHEYVMNKPS